MGCNCKVSGNKSEIVPKIKNSVEAKSNIQNFIHYSAKIIGFLIGVVLIPFISIAIIWFMFDTIVLSKEVDISFLLKKIIKVNKVIMTDDDDEDDEEEFDYEEEYITENIEENK